MKFAIKNRWTNAVLFEATLDAFLEKEGHSVQLGAAIKLAVSARANLSGADLSGANLSRANLSCADLSGADLSCANLSCADLSGAYLSCANLSGADLSRANLSGADLSPANLSGADLSRANLSGADLSRAYLSGADLSGAYLSGAKTDEKTVLPPLSILPDGALIGWKKLMGDIVAKLEIPAEAKRVNSTGRKCRAEYVKVLALYNGHDTKPLPKGTVGIGNHDRKTKYQAGKITKPDKYDPDFRVECSHGIHFFITRAEAEAY